MASAAVVIMLVGLTAYVVLAGADFGAGFWDLTAGGARRGGPVRGLVQRSMSPVWEANHVWLILVITIFWSAFPRAFGSVFSTLYVPLSAAALGIIMRGSAFALRGEAGTIREARTLGGLFAVSSVLVPFAMGAAVGAVASGRVPVGNAAGDPVSSWLNPTGVLVGLLSVAMGTFLAAVFLCADAARVGDGGLLRAFRRRAVGAGTATGALALAGLLVLHGDAPRLFDGLTAAGGLSLVVGSAVAGAGTLLLVARTRRFGVARLTAAAAVVCLVAAWAVAQQPDLLPGRLTIDEAAAGDETLRALLVVTAIAVAIVGPSLWLLFRLVLRGTLAQEYEPLDRRFRPLDAGPADGADRGGQGG